MQIGPYQVLGELGRGGMGVVYRARSAAGAEVALKVLVRSDKDAAARFDRERRLLAALGEEKGFVPILDAGESAQGPYVAMPLLTGGTLRDRLKRGAFAVDETLEVGRELARALGHAHALGIVHRDLKPENVIFDAATGRPFVVDLGLAKHFKSDAPGASQSSALSRTGALQGTFGYMAPEQARDAKTAGPPADVFSLGAILYESLAGQPAFEGASLVEVLEQVTQGEVAPLRRVRRDVPVWLAAAIHRALEKDPAARPGDALSFAQSLEPPPGGRRGLLVIAGLAGCLAIAAALGLVLLRGRDPGAVLPADRTAAPPPPPHRPVAPPAPPAPPGPRAPSEADREAAMKLSSRAMAKLERRDIAGAMEDFDAAIARDPTFAPAWANRGAARSLRGDHAGAIEDCTRAIEIDQDSMDGGVWATRALAKMNSGDLDGAIADCDRSIQIASENAVAWSNRGNAKLRKGDFDGAIEDCTRAIELNPEGPVPWGNRGSAKANKGDLAGALADYDRAVQLDPAKPDGWTMRATVKLRQLDPRGAAADLEKALEIEPRFARAWFYMGNAKENLNDREGALAAYERALELDPSNEASGILRRKIAQLRGRR